MKLSVAIALLSTVSATRLEFDDAVLVGMTEEQRADALQILDTQFAEIDEENSDPVEYE